MHTLGSLYGVGNGVERDLLKSCEWLALAAVRYGENESARRNHVMQMAVDEARLLSKEQMEEAARWVREWPPREHVSPRRGASSTQPTLCTASGRIHSTHDGDNGPRRPSDCLRRKGPFALV